MQTNQRQYFDAYRSVKMTRGTQGVLVVEFHTGGGPLIFTAQDHTEFVDAFDRIAQDRANKIVILTGTGGAPRSLHLRGERNHDRKHIENSPQSRLEEL